MKKFTFLVLMIFVIVKIQAQEYKISFAGTGASSKVDSIQVENLTQCKSISLIGSDILDLNVTNGINEINSSINNTLSVYPNPMTDYCLIKFNATAQSETTIGLYDIAGKRIAQVQEFLFKGQHTYKLSGAGSGIYILKVESNQYSYSAKIVSSNLTTGIAENRTQVTQINMMNADNYKNKESTATLSTSSSTKNTGAMKSLKNNKSLIDLPYTTGDTLKLTGFSAGIYSTVNMLVPTQNQTITFNFMACTDGDNNNYPVVRIGTQIWMEENLKTTKYNDGTEVPLVTDSTAWYNTFTPAYCWYNDDSTDYANTYGAIYNWFAVNTGKLCPSGWHVPTFAEWDTLIMYLGGEGIAGGKMKEACSTHWYSPNTGATNISGLTFLPGGYRDDHDGAFYYLGDVGYWWSTTVYGGMNADYFYLFYDVPNTYLCGWYYYEMTGFSVRCLKN